MELLLLVIFMLALIGLVAVILVVQAARRAMKRRRRVAEEAHQAAQPKAAFDPLGEDSTTQLFDPYKIKGGDQVGIPEGHFFVRGTIHFSLGSDHWKEHFLDTGLGTRRYLGVEVVDGRTVLTCWEEVKDCDAHPGAKNVVYNGITYRLDEHETARYKSELTTDLDPSGSRVEYWDYEEVGGTRLLSFECYDGGSIEVSVGYELDPSIVTYLPAS